MKSASKAEFLSKAFSRASSQGELCQGYRSHTPPFPSITSLTEDRAREGQCTQQCTHYCQHLLDHSIFVIPGLLLFPKAGGFPQLLHCQQLPPSTTEVETFLPLPQHLLIRQRKHSPEEEG